MTEYAIFQFLHNGKELAVEIPATSKTKRAWLGVYLLDPTEPGAHAILRRLGAPEKTTERLYRVRMFEIDRTINEDDVWISEQDLSNKRDVLAIGDGDLRSKLELLGVQLEQLERPFKSNYPI